MNITFYKYRVTKKESGESKLFFKYGDIAEFCRVPRSTLYKIFNGQTTSEWLEKFKFEQVRIPREMDLL